MRDGEGGCRQNCRARRRVAAALRIAWGSMYLCGITSRTPSCKGCLGISCAPVWLALLRNYQEVFEGR
jgi:hypothetical protein